MIEYHMTIDFLKTWIFFSSFDWKFIISSKMLALQFHPSENDFILKKNIPKPTLDEDKDEVLIKVEYAGLCGTDVHIVKVCFVFFM